MADNSTQTGADTIRDKDRSGVKTQIFGLDVNIGGTESLMSPTAPMPVRAGAASTSTLTSASIALTSFTVLAANTARLGAYLVNDSTQAVYIGFAATTSTTAYTVKLNPGDGVDTIIGNILYTGIITGIAAAASGSIRVTELT